MTGAGGGVLDLVGSMDAGAARFVAGACGGRRGWIGGGGGQDSGGARVEALAELPAFTLVAVLLHFFLPVTA
jgi:hypothetical protein